MGETKDKDAAGVKFFPPGIPLLIIAASLLLDQFAPLDAFFLPPAPARYWLGGAIVALAVLVLGAWSVKTMRSTGQSENPYKPTTEIVDSGPFAVTRNPMYLQMVLVCLGLGIAFANVWLLILTPLCAILLHVLVIKHEEIYLERKFGQAYLDYKESVRRWI